MGLGVCVVLTGEFRCGGIEEIENERVHITGVETLAVVWVVVEVCSSKLFQMAQGSVTYLAEPR